MLWVNCLYRYMKQCVLDNNVHSTSVYFIDHFMLLVVVEQIGLITQLNWS